MAIDNYETKSEFLSMHQKGICPICNKTLQNGEKLDLHHAGIHKTKQAKKKYPLMLDSVLNLIKLHHSCHLGAGANFGRMQEVDIILIEAFLKYIETCIKSGDMVQETKLYHRILKIANADKFPEYSKLRSQIIHIEKCDFDSIGFAIKQIWERLGE